MYRLGRLLSDLACDFERYVTLFRPTPPGRRAERSRVLWSSPGFLVVASYRITYWLRDRWISTRNPLAWVGFRAADWFFSRLHMIGFKTEIAQWADIGPGLHLADEGGITLGSLVVGRNCTLGRNLTLGMDIKQERPHLGDDVTIGDDSVVYGGVHVGDRTTVCADTVLSKTVPAGCVLRGKPARIVERPPPDGS